MSFSAINEVYCPTKPRTTPLNPTYGEEQNQRKVEGTLHPTVLDQIPQKPMITSLDLDEVSKAIRQTSSEKSPGMDGIPAEIYKPAGPVALLEALHSVPKRIWEEEDVPKKFRNATFISPCSRTGAVRLTAATTGTSFSCQSLGRTWLGSSSAASSPTSRRKTFPSKPKTTDMIFSALQVQKCIVQNMDLVAVFIDLTKAFDTINR